MREIAAPRLQWQPPMGGPGIRSCYPCRKRKSRCKFDETDPNVCLMCKVHETSCVFSAGQASQSGAAAAVHQRGPRKAARKSAAHTSAGSGQGSQQGRLDASRASDQHLSVTPFQPTTLSTDEHGEDVHVIGPILDAEARSIDNYLADGTAIGMPISLEWWTSLGDPLSGAQPVAFNKHVRRKPLGYNGEQSVAFSKNDIIERLLGPCTGSVIDLYFEKEHVCFPILDEPSFRSQYATSKQKMSPALLATIYAHTLVYWKTSSLLSSHHCPENRFVWNHATEALASELHLSPGVSTITAILLNIAGRPLTYMIGNGVLLGSAISLAHALGLNRDCSAWSIDPAEKSLRTRLWWALVVHDKWSSVAYGTPPRLRNTHHDVRPPSIASLYTFEQGTAEPPNKAHIFLALITLTEVLDKYLEETFTLNPGPGLTTSTTALDMEHELSLWETTLPVELRRAMIRGVQPTSAPGLPNLRLSYLYLRLLARKHVVDRFKFTPVGDTSILRNAYMHVRRAAEDIVLFVQELSKAAMAGFWFPLNAFAFSATVASLLRCALELEREQLATSISLRTAQDLLVALNSHRTLEDWDLGDICLAQYSGIVEKLLNTSSTTGLLDTNFADTNATGSSGLDLFAGSDVNWPFPELWELFTNR